MSMRDEFHRTNGRDHRRVPPKGNNYADPMAQADWESFQKGWQQSRDALVITLPNQYDPIYQEFFEDVDGGCFNYSKYLNDVRAVLAAAGLKVVS